MRSFKYLSEVVPNEKPRADIHLRRNIIHVKIIVVLKIGSASTSKFFFRIISYLMRKNIFIGMLCEGLMISSYFFRPLPTIFSIFLSAGYSEHVPIAVLKRRETDE